MTELLERLRQRKVVQWTLAYAAFAFALLQGLDIVAQQFGWPDGVRRGITIALAIGFFVTLVLAWYHGERGAQRASGTELLILALLLTIGGAVLWRVAQSPRDAADAVATGNGRAPAAAANNAPVDEKSIAVLPLANTSGDPSNEYFSDGLSEELISVLAKIPDLKTIGRSSSFHFKNSKEDSRTIGERLGVMHLLEGSVRKQGDHVRIAVELIKAADGRSVWSESFDRELKDIFAIQSEIAAAVVEQLKLKLLAAQPRSDAAPDGVNLSAYNELLQGQYFIQRFTEADLIRARDHAAAAVRLDPDYALAHAMLSRASRTLAAAFLLEPKEIDAAYRQARVSAQTALKLAPDLGEAHQALGWVHVNPDLDLPAAEQEFRRAVALTPRDARAAQSLAYLLTALGRLDEAEHEDARASELDPFFVAPLLNRARRQLARGDSTAATVSLRKVLELQADASHVYTYLTFADLMRGDAAAAQADSAREPAGFWHEFATTLAAQAQNGRAQADDILRRFEARYENGGAFQIAILYAFRKEPDRVFEWLRKAYDVNDSGLAQLMVTPFLLDYRGDPRFAEICRLLKIKVPAAARP